MFGRGLFFGGSGADAFWVAPVFRGWSMAVASVGVIRGRSGRRLAGGFFFDEPGLLCCLRDGLRGDGTASGCWRLARGPGCGGRGRVSCGVSVSGPVAHDDDDDDDELMMMMMLMMMMLMMVMMMMMMIMLRMLVMMLSLLMER